MPDNFDAWQAAGNAATNLANTVSVNKSDRRSRKFTREMYERTFNDNLRLWDMTNTYNSPEMQMKRLQKAGLNPNLAYGDMGDNSASSLPTPDIVPPTFRAAQMDKPDLMSIALANADLRIKQAQATNLNEQTDVIRQDAILRQWQARKAGFDFDFANEFRGFQAEALEESVRGRRVQSDLAINRDAREAIMQSHTVQEVAARVANLIEQNKGFVLERGQTRAETERILENIRQMQKDGRLKDFELKLNQDNMTKSDPLWARKILQFLTDGVDVSPNPAPLNNGSRFFPDGGHRQ